MQKVEVKIKGITPLLVNRYDTEGELEKKAKLKKRGSKELPNVEKKLYKNGHGNYIPSEWFEAAMKEAAKQFIEKGRRSYNKSVAGGVEVRPEELILTPQEWVTDIRSGVNRNCNPPARIIIERPRFDDWSVGMELHIDDDLDADIIKEILSHAGKKEGIGGFRPNKNGKFGKFEVVDYKVIKV